MDKFLSDAINTALTAAANKAVDATIREAFTATIDKAVKTQAKKLDKAFAAAVDNAVADRLDHLNALVQKATEIRIDKAVKKAVLEAKIEEVCFEPCVRWRKKYANAQGPRCNTRTMPSARCSTK
jgi:hypothetical protein